MNRLWLCFVTILPLLNPVKPVVRTFRGNKSSLPHKTCQACGRPMSWRRAWARTWDEVKFCSDACRRIRTGRG